MYVLFIAFFTFFTFFTFFAYTTSHPASYPVDFVPADPPRFMSFHVHVLFIQVNPLSVEEAFRLRNLTRSVFKEYLTEDCPGRYDWGRLCLIDDHDFMVPDGPFAVSEWSLFTPPHYYSLVVPWFTRHRGNLTILVHPNSGYEYNDHSTWAVWNGPTFALDLAHHFEDGVRTNEFNKTRGDSDEPVCAAEGVVCGVKNVGPGTYCCLGMACHCTESSHACTCQNYDQTAIL